MYIFNVNYIYRRARIFLDKHLETIYFANFHWPNGSTRRKLTGSNLKTLLSLRTMQPHGQLAWSCHVSPVLNGYCPTTALNLNGSCGQDTDRSFTVFNEPFYSPVCQGEETAGCTTSYWMNCIMPTSKVIDSVITIF